MKKNGQSIVELAAGLLVLVLVFGGLFDLAILMIAATKNDTCARDAARAASIGCPQQITFNGAIAGTHNQDALQRAGGVIKGVQSTGMISGPYFIVGGAKQTAPPTTATSNDPDTGPQNLVAPPSSTGGAWEGSYRITTGVDVNLPFPVPGVASPIQLKSRQEFPITRYDVPP